MPNNKEIEKRIGNYLYKNFRWWREYPTGLVELKPELADILDNCLEHTNLSVQKALEEVIELVQENRQGTFMDDAGHDCWYLEDLVIALKTHLKEKGLE